MRKASLPKLDEKQGIEKYEFYVDDGYNGNTLDRPALKQLIKDMKTGSVAAVIIAHDDRLAKGSIVNLEISKADT